MDAQDVAAGDVKWTAIENGETRVTIPAALAQAEGIVVEMFQHRGDIKMKTLVDYLLSIQDGTDLYGLSVESFVTRFLFEKFRHGDPLPAFSRHAILHGADTNYGTKDKSLRSIIWVDYLLISREERAGLPSGISSESNQLSLDAVATPTAGPGAMTPGGGEPGER